MLKERAITIRRTTRKGDSVEVEEISKRYQWDENGKLVSVKVKEMSSRKEWSPLSDLNR